MYITGQQTVKKSKLFASDFAVNEIKFYRV